jgi:hypothetical protein
MNCENLQLNLPIYLDDVLTVEERAIIEKHLAGCSLCRQKLNDFQSLRNDLRVLARPEMPKDLLASVRNRVAQEIKSNQPQEARLPQKNIYEWLQMRVMPYAVGTVASLVLGFMLLTSLLNHTNTSSQNADFAKYEPFTKSDVLLANANPKMNAEDFQLSAADFAAARLSISNESPSINPQGALVALTKAFVRGKMKDDEVVVVADVFGNGLAQIAEVVEPSRDRHAVRELEQALKNNPDYAPFVPANIDHRSETVRVIFKIQSVNVETNTKGKRK